MHDPRIAPAQMLVVARMLEANGDAISAIMAYRDVLLAGEETTSAQARQRLEQLARRSLTERTA